MELNKVIAILDENNFKYSVKNEIVIVFLEFSQDVIIDLSDSGKVKISDQLVGWNFLTGCIKMSLKQAFLYNFFLLVFLGFLCQYAQLINQDFTSLLLLLIGWILMFTTFYLVKLESFKLQFIALTK
jgi:hypothetical protein